MDIKKLLEKVKKNEITVDDAELLLRRKPYEDMGFARLDTHRGIRAGFPEVIFSQGKQDQYFTAIFRKLFETEGQVLATRASQHQFELIADEYPEAEYISEAGIIKLQPDSSEKKGLVTVISAGTSDIPVAEEAAQTAEYFGCQVERVYDAGVCGLHRLLDSLEVIQRANCVIAVAGMEGALGSVVGGLVDKPVIAVPTSVGYGANFHGISALLSMLNSCANGIAVVNIDNGYGAGYIAAQINRMGVRL